MAAVKKWNAKIRKYSTHVVPNDWKIRVICGDMDEIINCVNCGKKIKFGDGYTSKRYHNSAGFGYQECEKCYFNYKE